MELDKKPASMSMKDFLVRTQAVKMMISERVIDAVVSHQFQSALQAVREHNSVEISGFGKFLFNEGKAVKKLNNQLEKLAAVQEKLNSGDLTEAKRQKYTRIFETTSAEIEHLKTKLNEPSTNLRGMEEQVDSCIRYEGED